MDTHIHKHTTTSGNLFIFLSNGSGVWGWAGLVGWAGGDAGPSSRSGHDSKARCVENVLFFLEELQFLALAC